MKTGFIKHFKGDARYTLTREYCGYAEPRYVVRFCDDWVGQGETKADAAMLYIAHSDARERVLRGES